jgi:PAS domain S-box-containing protein
MAEIVSQENRFRLFLGFLILVLVIVNSQSLHLSYTSRQLLEDSFRTAARATAEMVASRLWPALPDGPVTFVDAPVVAPSLARVTELLKVLEQENSLVSACLLDWNGQVRAGSSDCAFSQSREFDRLDRQGRRELVEQGWAMSEVFPAYEPESASAFGYLTLERSDGSEAGVLRVQLPASSVAVANRAFRSTLIYQVSAMALVLLTLVLFLNSLLAPHRRLVAEARSVAGELTTDARSQDEGQFLLATFQDIVAKLKEKEKQLAEMHRLEKARADESQALATDIIRTMNTGLVSLDERGQVVLVNPAAEKIFGVDARSLERKSYGRAFPGSQELADSVAGALSKGEHALRRRVEYRLVSGNTIHLGASVLPLGQAGHVRGALCLFADLTEVIELRERLFVKENLARLGEMAAGIAHEFRNSLATIVGNAKLLGKELTSEEATTLVDALIDESDSLGRVVTDFLQFARPEALRPSFFDLAEMADDLRRDLEPKAAGAGVRLVIEARPFEVEADEVLLRKAVSNLMLNAIEAARQEGNRGEVRVEAGGADGRGFIRVSDNGPGVREGDLARIFTPFFTTKPEGTGLGLSIVQKIAVSHNGEVQVGAAPGGGASFTLNLPSRPVRNPVGPVGEEEWV